MKLKEIRSWQNPFFKKLLRLKNSRGIKKYGLALLSGEKNVKELLDLLPGRCRGIVTCSIDLVGSLPIEPGCPVYLLAKNLFASLDFHGTGKPIALLKVDPLQQWDEALHKEGCALFIPFQDPANVGAAIRSAAAFGVRKIVLMEEAAHPYHHKSLRAAGSTVLQVKLMRGPSINNFSIHGFPLLVLDPQGRDIRTYRFPRAFGLLAGLEGPGLPCTVKDTDSLSIPMEGNINSLNAAVAVGIALYQWRASISPE